VLGSINDTCIMIRILIQKMYQVSSIMIHFWNSISISITDTFRVYQYHKSLIHDYDTFIGIQNSLLTRFAIINVESHILPVVLLRPNAKHQIIWNANNATTIIENDMKMVARYSQIQHNSTTVCTS